MLIRKGVFLEDIDAIIVVSDAIYRLKGFLDKRSKTLLLKQNIKLFVI